MLICEFIPSEKWGYIIQNILKIMKYKMYMNYEINYAYLLIQNEKCISFHFMKLYF